MKTLDEALADEKAAHTAYHKAVQAYLLKEPFTRDVDRRLWPALCAARDEVARATVRDAARKDNP
jgi:hypothetical protein